MTTPTPRTDALIRFEFGDTGQPFPAHALLAMMQLARQLERDLAAAQEARQAAEARAESYLEILREVDGLIKYQYSGSREAMSYLQHIANRVFTAIDAAIAEGK